MVKYLRLTGSISALMGLLIALTPHFLAPVCKTNMILQNGMEAHMKCFWTGQAAIVLGILILITGLFMLLAQKRETVKFLAVVEGAMAIALLIIPTDFVIGICADEKMACHTTTFFLNIWSVILIAMTVITLVLPSSQSENIDLAA